MDYVKTKNELVEILDAKRQAVEAIQVYWHALFDTEANVPSMQTILRWLASFAAEELIEAIDKFVPKRQKDPEHFSDTDTCISYVSGILWNTRIQRIQEMQSSRVREFRRHQ